MPSKRQPLTFPELEPKGRGAILRSAEEVAAEAELLAAHEAETLENRNSANAESQSVAIPQMRKAANAESQNSGTTESRRFDTVDAPQAAHRATYRKASYRLRDDAWDAIEDMKRLLRRNHGLKVSLEDIAEAAILAAYAELVTQEQASAVVRILSHQRDHADD